MDSTLDALLNEAAVATARYEAAVAALAEAEQEEEAAHAAFRDARSKLREFMDSEVLKRRSRDENEESPDERSVSGCC